MHKRDPLEVVHALESLNEGGSVLTACNGRWAITEPYEVWPVDGAPHERTCCSFCEGRFVDEKFVDRGLRELVENTYSIIGRETRRFSGELERHSPADRAGFELWLGPCPHGLSPITRCAQ